MPKATVVAGNFDGVHKGHQRLIELGKTVAKEAGETLAVFTFYPQPQELFHADFCYLLSEKEKEKKFRELGVEEIYSVPFHEEIANLSPEEFITEILIEQMQASHVVVGFNYSFGKNGSGTPEDMKRIGEAHGLSVTVMEPYCQEEEIISSSVIRRYLVDCEIEKVNRFLGYDYSIEGVVEKGRQLGRTIGYPTANIALPHKQLLPGVGVYAAMTYVDGVAYQSFLNVGFRPTVAGSVGETVEVHIFDFDGDLYGKVIRTELRYFLRGERKFAGLEALKNQLKSDEERSRALLSRR